MTGAAYSIPECFMTALLCGAAFGLVYELLRLFRTIFRLRAVIFLCDVAFFALSALFLFKLSLALGNYVRIYTVLGFALGVFSYIVTIGRLFNAAENALSRAARRFFGRIFRFIGGKTAALFGKIAHKANTVFVNIAENRVKRQKNSPKRLKKPHRMLYNKTVSTGGEGKNNGIKAHTTRCP